MEFLGKTVFSEAFKEDILGSEVSSERQQKFNRYSRMHQHNDALIKVRDFGVSLDKNGIFLQPDLKKDMNDLLRIIGNAMSEEKVNIEERPMPRLRDDHKIFRAEARLLVDKIEKSVSERLWSSTTAEV